MSAVETRIAAGLALAVMALIPATAAAQPRCQFATSGDGLAITIAVRGTAGLRLRLDWGDGTVESVRRLDDARERGYIRHEYATAGRYTIVAEARDPTGGGCRLESELDVPYPAATDSDSLTLLPQPGTGPDEPDPEPFGPPLTGSSRNPAGPVTATLVRDDDSPTATSEPLQYLEPRRTSPSDSSGASLFERMADLLGQAIGGFFGWFGRR